MLLFLFLDATAPGDFSLASSTVRFTPTSQRHCLNVTINEDNDAESTERFTVHLVANDFPPYASLRRTSATVYINDRYGMCIAGP
jgi:hypothetical protein